MSNRKRIYRLGLSLGLLGTLTACQVIDNVMGIPPSSPIVVQPQIIPPVEPPKPSKTVPKRMESVLVIYVGSTSPIADYVQVEQKGRTVYVDSRQTLLYTDLQNALAVLDKANRPYVNLMFSPTGAQKLDQLTANNFGKQLIVTLNNELIGIVKIDGRNTQGVLQVPMNTVSDAQIVERKLLDGE